MLQQRDREREEEEEQQEAGLVQWERSEVCPKTGNRKSKSIAFRFAGNSNRQATITTRQQQRGNNNDDNMQQQV